MPIHILKALLAKWYSLVTPLELMETPNWRSVSQMVQKLPSRTSWC